MFPAESCLPTVTDGKARAARAAGPLFVIGDRPKARRLIRAQEFLVHQLLNTLYVQTPRSYLHLDHETLKVKLEDETRLQVPSVHLGAVFCFGDVTVSTALLHRCGPTADPSFSSISPADIRLASRDRPRQRPLAARSARGLDGSGRTLAVCRAVVAAKSERTSGTLRGAGGEPPKTPATPGRARHRRYGAAPGRRSRMRTSCEARRGRGRHYYKVFGRLVREAAGRVRHERPTRRPATGPA